jgi:hypothetical protein
MLIKVENGAPIGHPIIEENFRQLFADVVFPLVFTNEIVESYGYAMYDFSQIPTPAIYEKLTEGTPVKDAAGIYRQNWVLVPMTDEEKAQADADRLDLQKAYVRAERNAKLTASDWTQLSDSPVDKAAWATHRQALRDVTAQSGFPWTIDWPVAP